MFRRIALALLVPFCAAAHARAQELVAGKALEIELTARDPVLEPYGPARGFEYHAHSLGTLYVWASSPGLDPILRIASTDGETLAEDDDSGGGTTAFRAFAVRSDQALFVVVAGKTPGSSGKLVLHACEVPEDRNVDLTPERKLMGESSAARGTRDYGTARTKVAETISSLLARARSERGAAWLALLDSAGRAAWDAQDHDAARDAWREVVEMRTRTLSPEHPDLQQARMNLASTLYMQGDLPAARALQEQVLEVDLRTLSPEHPDLQQARGNLALTVWRQGDLRTARALFEQVLEVFSRTLPAEHPNLQWARLNLANTLVAQGDLPAARAMFEQVVEVDSRTLPPEHPDLQRARMNLAITLEGLGELPAARALEEQVLEVFSRTLPSEHPDLQKARLSLARTLYAQGDLPAARALQEQVLEVYSRTLPPEHPELQAAHMDVAMTLEKLGDLRAARTIYEQVLEVRSRTLPPEHPDLQAVRGNLANTLRDQGDLPAARARFEQLLEVYSRTLPPEHTDLQGARLGLAGVLERQGDLPHARALQEEVLEVYSRTLPPEHSHLQRVRMHLADTLARFSAALRAGNSEEEKEREEGGRQCAELVHSVAESASRIARAVMLSTSSREAEERCSRLDESLSVSLSFAAGYGVFDPDPELDRDAFVLSETTRASALASARIARLARGDERYGVLRKEIQSAGEALAGLVQGGSQPEAFNAAIARRDRAQRELVQLASQFTDSAGLFVEPDPAVLAGSLAEAEAIVAYRRYTRRQIPSGKSNVRSTESLCAFVLRKGTDLQRIELGAIEPIESAVKEWRLALGTAQGRGVAVGERAGDSFVASEHARRIAALVFDPLVPKLRGARRLVMIVDDVLHAVPMDALLVREAATNGSSATSSASGATLIGDRYEIELRSTIQEFVREPWSLSGAAPAGSAPCGDARSPTGAALVVALGGADYDGEPERNTADRTQTIAQAPGVDAGARSSSAASSVLRDGAWKGGFGPLPGTLSEAHGLSKLASNGSEDLPIVLLEGRQASRRSIEELAPKARFLHLATHGWFAPESVRSWSDPEPREKSASFGSAIEHAQGEISQSTGTSGLGPRMTAEERVKGSSPMLLCGLALAGANLPADAIGRYPGLVTAEEISSWDLSSCELAVLSACDTNVGERRAGQGVASLQQALHMAGARTVITSSWKVPDEATKELMLDFYRRIWVEHAPKAQALWEAKRKLREAKDERGEPKYTTRDWAAWVLTGDPR